MSFAAVSRFLKWGPAALGAAAVATWLCSCATRSYSPLGENTTLTPFVVPPEPPGPEIIVLPDEQAPVIGLDNVDAGPLPVVTNTPVPAAASTINFGRGWIPLSVWTSRWCLSRPTRPIRSSLA